MIGQRLEALRRQPFGGFIGELARKAIDDPAVARMRLLDEVQKLLPGIILDRDAVMDIRTIKAGDEGAPIGEPRRSTMSLRVGLSAVAVRASRGTEGNCSAKALNWV